MKKIKIGVVFSFLILGSISSYADELSNSSEPQGFSSPERVQIYSIAGRTLTHHPSSINVLPGEQIAFRADVLQYGNACPHPEGCPEGRSPEQFVWSASDHSDDECSPRSPEACRDRTSFQPDGIEMIFHIPYAMGHDITVRVVNEGLSSEDSIVLHNAHFQNFAEGARYNDGRDESYVYPRLAPPGMEEPYWGPYYSYAGWWGPYPYYYYPWGWGGPGWTFSVAWGFGPAWGWGWGWYGPYHPGIYGYYHPGWWHPGYGTAWGPRAWHPGTPELVQRAERPLPSRPVGYGERSETGSRVQRGSRRGRWR